MSIAEFNGPFPVASAHVAVARATDWEEMHRINYFKKYRLVDGSTYRGLASLMRRRTASDAFEYRRLNQFEADSLLSFEQQW